MRVLIPWRPVSISMSQPHAGTREGREGTVEIAFRNGGRGGGGGRAKRIRNHGAIGKRQLDGIFNGIHAPRIIFVPCIFPYIRYSFFLSLSPSPIPYHTIVFPLSFSFLYLYPRGENAAPRHPPSQMSPSRNEISIVSIDRSVDRSIRSRCPPPLSTALA